MAMSTSTTKMSISSLQTGHTSKSASETEQLAEQLAEFIPPNTTLALHGDLGAGKTTFIRGLARGFAISEPITSPTFNLYSIYEGARQLIHLDAYRLSSGSDLDSLMIQDFMKSPWCFAVEWPERIADAIPEDCWHLHFNINSEGEHLIHLKIGH